MITASGIGSGLDIEGLVSQLVAAERAPTENRLSRQDARLTSELSAFGIFKGALSSFQDSLADLNTLSKFGQHISTSSDTDIVETSSSGQAVAGSYELNVSQLAKSHSLASGGYLSTADTVGTGTLTIRFGTTDYTPPDPGPESYNSFAVNPERGVATISIDSSNNTLEGLRDAINDAEIGVSAAIVNDGSGYRLLLSSSQTGEENGIEISVDDTGDNNDLDSNGLSALAFNSGAAHLSQTVAAQDAIFSINGLSITTSHNTADNVIDGVNLTLKGLSGASPVTLTVAEDHASVKEAITSLVSGYNSFVEIAGGLTAYDAATGSAGVLQGDFSVRSIVGQIRQVLTSAVTGFGGAISSLSEIGITTERDGSLSVDSTGLDDALEQHFDEMVGLFTAVGFPSDANIEFVGSSDQTVVASHAIEVSQLASSGQLLGAVAAFPVDIDDGNDSFTIKVDGILSDSISLTQGNYASGGVLAAEMQLRINGDAALVDEGVKVAVVFNVDHFEITSERYGSGSRVEITAVDTNSVAQLGLSIAMGPAGLDVAGTMGGVAATGAGQLLTGAVGSDAQGLKLLINGGATGVRGSVDYSRGISHQLDALLSGFLESDGILDSRADGLQGRVDGIEDQRERLDRRMEALEARYRSRFNALDSLMAQLQSTSAFLSQQLALLPKAGSLNNNN